MTVYLNKKKLELNFVKERFFLLKNQNMHIKQQFCAIKPAIKIHVTY